MWNIHMCDTTNVFVSHHPCICVTGARLSRLESSFSHAYVWHDWCICVTWLMHMRNMTRVYVWKARDEQDSKNRFRMHMYKMTHVHVWHDSCILVTCHMHVPLCMTGARRLVLEDSFLPRSDYFEATLQVHSRGIFTHMYPPKRLIPNVLANKHYSSDCLKHHISGQSVCWCACILRACMFICVYACWCVCVCACVCVCLGMLVWVCVCVCVCVCVWVCVCVCVRVFCVCVCVCVLCKRAPFFGMHEAPYLRSVCMLICLHSSCLYVNICMCMHVGVCVCFYACVRFTCECVFV